MVTWAAAQANGLPPKVLAWEPGPQSRSSACQTVTPSGRPEAIPLAMHTTSGTMPDSMKPNILPVRPMPRLHLVADQLDAVLGGHLAQAAQELRRRVHVAALALDGLHKDRRHVLRVRDLLEDRVRESSSGTPGCTTPFFCPKGQRKQ